MNTNQRLDYTRLSDALGERGLVPPDALREILRQAPDTGGLFTETLVRDSLISDWELSRVAADIFSLPFLPVDIYPPDESAREGLDEDFLRRYCLVPLDRFAGILTVSMPAIVPADVLTNLARLSSSHVLAVVGSVNTNRRWLEEHLPAPILDEVGAPLPLGRPDQDDAWADMFDAADEAVRLDISTDDLPPGEE